MNNYFGHRVYETETLFQDEKVSVLIKKSIAQILSNLEIKENLQELIEETTRVKTTDDVRQIEEIWNQLFESPKFQNKTKTAFRNRANLISTQIRPFLNGGSVLADIGAGDGLVTKTFDTLYENIHLYDLIDYLDPSIEQHFCLLNEDEPNTIRPATDALLLTVLHHARNLDKLFNEVAKATLNRIIVLESIIPDDISVSYTGYEEVRILDQPKLMKYVSAVDWFYNRCIHRNVQTPYNYNTNNGWISFFKKYGLHPVSVSFLGKDQPLVPELHVLYVLEKST